MRKTIELIIIAIIAVVALFHLGTADTHGIIRYNCDLAEISPDFPIEVKNQCRKLRASYI